MSNPVITGASAICSLGDDLHEIVYKIYNNEPAFIEAGNSWGGAGSRKIAPAAFFNPSELVKKNRFYRYMSRETKFAASALAMCLGYAGIVPGNTHPESSIALFAGTGSSGLDFDYIQNMLDNSANSETGLFDSARFAADGIPRMNPLTSFKILPNMPAAVGAINSLVRGANLIFNPWEGNALHALKEGFHEIKSGRNKIVMCGGSDSRTHTGALVSLTEYGLFDKSDVVLSEGSAFVALEDYESAQSRCANIMCRVKAISTESVVPENIAGYSPDAGLYEFLMEDALLEAGLSWDKLDFIICSSDFNKLNDEAEKQAIFQGCTKKVKKLSPKKIAGNTFAAAGFLSVAIAAHILEWEFPAGGRPINNVLVNSFGPGSEKFCIVLERI